MTTSVLDSHELRSLSLFSRCHPADLAAVAASVTQTVTLPEGTVICREGETAAQWWIVAEGLADVTTGGRYVSTIGSGETIGELALLDGERRNATVVAGTDVVLHVVDGTSFLQVLHEHPGLSIALLRQLAGRMRQANDRLVGNTPSPSAGAAADVAPLASSTSVADPTTSNASTCYDVTPTIDPSLPGYFADPYAVYRTLRDTDPVHYSESLGAFFVTRYEDVHRLTRDRTLMVNIDFATSTPMIDAERSRLQELHSPPTILQLDGDDHNRLRRLVTRVFTPKAIASWRDRADTIVEGLLAGAMTRDELDLIDDYALILPAQIISEMLGMPSKDIPDLRRWSNALSKTLDPINTPEEQQAATDAGRSMGGFIKEVIDHKRINPGDDILSALISAKDENQSLNTGELIVQVLTLYIAGHETTLNLIGNSFTHLFESPKQLDLLRTDPNNDANAVEELLRFDSPVQFTRRIAAESFVVGDTEIPAGSVVFLGLGSANRDPRKWGPTADQIDLYRAGANEHQSFGGGAHYCLGAALARLEAQIAIPRLARRFPRMTPAYETPAWSRRITLRGVGHLPVRLNHS
jgi:cytochrome P450/CRP-like cAMP-binding protein